MTDEAKLELFNRLVDYLITSSESMYEIARELESDPAHASHVSALDWETGSAKILITEVIHLCVNLSI
jgi:hypothetical protein